MVSGVAAFVLVTVLVLDYFTDGTLPSQTSLLLLGTIIIAAVTLFLPALENLRYVRAVELVVVFGFVLFLALRLSRVLAEADSAELGLAAWNRSLLHFTLVMGSYAVLVLNRTRRAAAVMLPIAVTPLIVGFFAGAPVEKALDRAQLIDGAVLLAIAFGVSVVAVTLVGFLLNKMSEKLTDTQYDLIDKIGAGGMGEVWLARHRALARPAAIKLIKPEVVSEDPKEAERVLRRFEREAQTTAALRSPNTVEIYDFGVARDGTFYYVMEYLDGWDLDALIRRHGPLEPERVIFLLDQLCESLSDAHNNQLIHRDIKPANVHVSRMGTFCDFVKVLDFGLVKTEGEMEETGHHGTDGQLTGTPAFISPEMALGDRDIDPRSDIYAVGCVAYWMLTGQLVFDEKTPVRAALAHATVEPTPPSHHTEIEIPEVLDRIVLKCLAKDPEDRYRSVRELQDALAEVATVGVWDRRRAERWWSGHRPASLALAG